MESESWRETEYSSNDASSHTVSYYRDTWRYCLDCGVTYNMVEATERTVTTEPHYFYDGVCQSCGATNTCLHSSAVPNPSLRDVQYSYADANTHSRSYYVDYYYSCSECGESWTTVATERSTDQENHSWANGECQLCHYSCNHENRTVTATQWLNATYTQKDGENHVVSGFRRDSCTCLSCGISWVETSETLTEADQAHAYEEGACTLCGYACQHAQANQAETIVVKYSQNGADSHIKTGYKGTYNTCEICGSEWDVATVDVLQSVQEMHYYNNGVCSKCGYACQHERVMNDGSSFDFDDTTYSDGNAEGHLTTGYRWDCYRCVDCDYCYDKKTSEIVTERKSHWFADGVCEACGYQNQCTHDDAEEEYHYWEDEQYSDPTPYDHVVTGYRGAALYCSSCGELMIRVDDQLSSEREDHEIINGKCRKCGYVKACPHENVDITVSWSDRTYSNIDDQGHTESGVRTIYYYCLDCQYEWQEGGTEYISVQTPHDFEEGICWKCGYVNFCPHENVTIETEWGEECQYSDPTEEGHLITGFCWHNYECQDCGERWFRWGYQEDPVRVEHRYNIYGVCYRCKFACEHAGTETIWSKALGEPTYTSVDAEKHNANTEMLLRKECPTCKNGFTTTEIVTVARMHNFENGVCADCGYVCQHDAKYQDQWWRYESSSSNYYNEWYHEILLTNPILVTDCTLCWQTVDEQKFEDEIRSLGWHEGDLDEEDEDSNVCSSCGYTFRGVEKPICEHTDLQPKNQYLENIRVVSADESGHTIIADRVQNYECTVCDVGSGLEKVETAVEITAPHTVDSSNVCEECGYELSCPHANVVRDTSLEKYEMVVNQHCAQKDENSHLIYGFIDYRHICTDCGAYVPVNGGDREALTGLEAPHEFIGNICVGCRYVKPEPVSTPTATATATPTATATATPIPTATATPVPTATATPVPTATATPVPTATATPIPTATATPVPTATATPVPTATATPIPTATATPVPTATATPIPTATATPVPTATATPVPTATMPTVSDEPTMPVVTDAPVATPAPTVRPTAKPVATATPTAAPTLEPTLEPTVEPTAVPTPEPVYEEVSVEEVVHGVKVEDAAPMVETMMTVADALETESEPVTIQIVNIEKVITTKEKEVLEQLPVKEQLLTFLSVIGFEAQVNQAMEASESSFSLEAEALKAQIQTRIESMDEAARAEFETALLESFPQEVVVIDGVEYNFFVLEIEVRVGDSIRYERYGFRREGDEWIFTRLEIGE